MLHLDLGLHLFLPVWSFHAAWPFYDGVYLDEVVLELEDGSHSFVWILIGRETATEVGRKVHEMIGEVASPCNSLSSRRWFPDALGSCSRLPSTGLRAKRENQDVRDHVLTWLAHGRLFRERESHSLK